MYCPCGFGEFQLDFDFAVDGHVGEMEVFDDVRDVDSSMARGIRHAAHSTVAS